MRQRALNAVARQVRLIGHQLAGNVHELRRSSVIGLAVGRLALIWGTSGLAQAGLFTMAQVWTPRRAGAATSVTRWPGRSASALPRVSALDGEPWAAAAAAGDASHVVGLRHAELVPGPGRSNPAGLAVGTAMQVPALPLCREAAERLAGPSTSQAGWASCQ